MEEIKIFISPFINTKLKLKNFLCFKLINKKIALNHEDIEVAIGIIKKPISLKKIILIKIFRNTEAREI